MDEKIVKDSQGLAKELVNDCISRTAAIDEVINLWADKPFGRPALVEIKDCIEKLPSAQPYTDEEIQKMQDIEQAQLDKAYELGYQAGRAAQPERQKGEWIDYTEDGYVECPFCHSATNCDGNKDELHFCFSCGADMRGEQDE